MFTLEDAPYLRSIANVMRTSGCDIPEWMTAMDRAPYGDATLARRRTHSVGRL